MFMQLAGKNVRSSFDFMDGFFQIGLPEDSKSTTFFVSRKSGSCIMKFNRSIQGSKNASAVFTRAMQVTFSHLQDIVNFWVDNLIALSKNAKEHLDHLDTIFARTLDSNLKMSPEKCKFLTGEIKYLGIIVKDDSFFIAEKKLQAIQELPIPKTYNNLPSQLALFQYYKKFISFFNDITCVMGKLIFLFFGLKSTQMHTIC